MLRRPHSAKLGASSQINLTSEEVTEYGMIKNRRNKKRKHRLVRGQCASNEFSRLIPKKVKIQKEKLYQDGIQLKITINELKEENTRLKTKISILEKQRIKKYKFRETDHCNHHSPNYSKDKSIDKQNHMIQNLKKMISDANQQINTLKQENTKVKKNIKYTKINELEIQRKMVLEENRRINQVLQKCKNRLNEQYTYQKEIFSLKGYLEEQMNANQQLTRENQKYAQLLRGMQEKSKCITLRFQERQRKWQRELAEQKRNFNQEVKRSNQMKKQIKTLRESKNHTPKSKNHSALSKSSNFDKKQIEQLKQRNREIQAELKELKLKLNQKTIKENKRNSKEEFIDNQPQFIIQQNSSLQNTKKNDQNNEKIQQIRELVTYRLKAQRYPFEELEKDIIGSQSTQFAYKDIQNMILQEPFYLAQSYADEFLKFAFQKLAINDKNESISTDKLLQKLNKIIANFQLPSQSKEEQMLLKVAQMTTTYPTELEIAFNKIKNGPNTVPKQKLIQMFKELELTQQYIQLIISELTLCSEDLEHLNVNGYFQRFFLQQNDERNQAIHEEPEQSSGEFNQNGKEHSKMKQF